MKQVKKLKRFIEMSLLVLFLLLISINTGATADQYSTTYIVDE